MRFRGVLLLNGKTATGIEVPADVVAALGPAKRLAVRVTIGAYSYRSTVAPMGGAFMLPVSAEHRRGAGIAAGDEIVVDLELDDEPREVTVPPDLADALEGEAQAKRFFDGLAYTHRKEYVRWIEEAKRAETRERRIVKAVGMLREGKSRT